MSVSGRDVDRQQATDEMLEWRTLLAAATGQDKELCFGMNGQGGGRVVEGRYLIHDTV